MRLARTLEGKYLLIQTHTFQLDEPASYLIGKRIAFFLSEDREFTIRVGQDLAFGGTNTSNILLCVYVRDLIAKHSSPNHMIDKFWQSYLRRCLGYHRHILEFICQLLIGGDLLFDRIIYLAQDLSGGNSKIKLFNNN